METSAQNNQVTRRGLAAELLVVAGFCAFLFYFGLGSFGLAGADEPRYAQVAREMLARHDWITPVLNGVAWLEKPVLYYWSAMLSYSVFGVTDWAARVPTAVFASAMLVAVYFFMRRFRPGAQLDAALIAASSAAIIGFGRAASTDMPLAATFSIGMLGWYAWLETNHRGWLAGFYLLIGFGTLAKGPVAPFLAAVIIVIFSVTRREPRLILRTLWWPGVLLFFIVAAPWYVAVQLRNPEFFRVFFLEHNLERFAKDVFHHRQPFWYYVPVLLLSVAPWTVYAVVALLAAFRRAKTQASEPLGDSLRLFLVIWLLVPVVFFSLAQSKLPGYILPAVPAFPLLLADYLRSRYAEDRKPSFVLVVLHSAVGAVLLAAVLLMHYFVLRVPAPQSAKLVAGVVAAVVFVGMALTLRLRGMRMLRFITLVPVILGLAFIIRVGAPTLDNSFSARPVEHELERIDPSHMELGVFKVKREVEYGLNFYRNQPIRNYDRAEIPAGQHLVVARAGSQADLQAILPGRRVSRIGEFAPQHLEFFWVGGPGSAMHHHGG